MMLSDPSQNGADSQQHFMHIEWLGYEIVSAALERDNAFRYVVAIA